MPELPRPFPLSEKSKLATGTEKTVYVDGVDKVVKVYRGSHRDKKAAVSLEKAYDKVKWRRLLAQEFYLTKIVRLLFPNTVADIHMASVASDAAPQSLHQRIKPADGRWARLCAFVDSLRDMERDSDKARRIDDAYWNAGVELQFTKDNFTYDEQRRLHYIDSLGVKDIDMLQQTISQRLSGDEQKRAQAYLDRLRHHLSL